jgi:hypothetical protein
MKRTMFIALLAAGALVACDGGAERSQSVGGPTTKAKATPGDGDAPMDGADGVEF